MAFQCVIVTPEQQVFDEPVVQAILPAHDGLVGILTGRAPLLVQIGLGPLRVDIAGGRSRVFFVDGGVAQMTGERLTVLTNEATPPEEIDPEAAQAEYAAAAAKPITDERSYDDRDRQMRRAKAKQEMAAAK